MSATAVGTTLRGGGALGPGRVPCATRTPTAGAEQAGSKQKRLPAGFFGAGGDFHTCAVLDNGAVRCWGYGGDRPARLRQHDDDRRQRDARLGRRRSTSGRPTGARDQRPATTTRARSSTTARCAAGASAATGGSATATRRDIGDNETPGVGRPGRPRAPGARRARSRRATTTPARSSTTARCAAGATATTASSATATPTTIGDNETPGSVGPVDLGAGRTAVAITRRRVHTCAILDNGTVRCWGLGDDGQLGYGNTDDIGDNETPGSVGPVDLGAGRDGDGDHRRRSTTPARSSTTARCAAGAMAAQRPARLRQHDGHRRQRDARLGRPGEPRRGAHGDRDHRRRQPHLRAARRRQGALLGRGRPAASSATATALRSATTRRPAPSARWTSARGEASRSAPAATHLRAPRQRHGALLGQRRLRQAGLGNTEHDRRRRGPARPRVDRSSGGSCRDPRSRRARRSERRRLRHAAAISGTAACAAGVRRMRRQLACGADTTARRHEAPSSAAADRSFRATGDGDRRWGRRTLAPHARSGERALLGHGSGG